MYWPANKRYKIAGNYLSNNFRYISIILRRWVYEAKWKTPTEIDEKIRQMVVTIVYLNSYMDFNDFETPVKTTLDDKISYYIKSNEVKIIKMYAKLNKATLNDDYLKLKSAVDKQFFSIDRVQNDSALDEVYIFNGNIFMDPNRDLYQRSVFTILDLFGTIGGIYGLLVSACGFMIGFISTQVMLSSIFRRLYYTNKYSLKSLALDMKEKLDEHPSSLIEENKEEIN